MTLGEWVRTVLLAAPGVELPPDDAALAGRVTLAEVLALRTLFLNLQFRQSQGPMTEAEMWEPAPTAEELFAALDVEAEEEDRE